MKRRQTDSTIGSMTGRAAGSRAGQAARSADRPAGCFSGSSSDSRTDSSGSRIRAAARRGRHRLRRLVQGASLALFLFLLVQAGLAGSTGKTFLPADLFLRLDPSALVAALAGTVLPASLLPALATIVAAALFGRIFCGWVCPMGASLDLFGGGLRWLTGRGRRKQAGKTAQPVLPAGPGSGKFLILACVTAAALFGLNLVFWVSPMALVTRLWAMLLLPAAETSVTAGLELAAPLLESLGAADLLYLHLDGRFFQTSGAVLVIWAIVLGLECLHPRFWCRYLCPAGAMLSLAARLAPRALRRDRTRCIHCQRCSAVCPQGLAPGLACGLEAGLEAGQGTSLASGPAQSVLSCRESAGECLTCQACTAVCPVGALRYGRRAPEDAAGQTAGPAQAPVSAEGVQVTASAVRPAAQPAVQPPAQSGRTQSVLPTRRAFCASFASGTVLAGLAPLADASARIPVRAPGALPEEDFLAVCLRCGACMRACPTKALQPAWFEAGLPGMFSPVLVPRSGACAPECLACGAICPTHAILTLTQQEKVWARVGTAVVKKDLCLAWAEDRRCMVCKENCPYGAVDVIAQEGRLIPVPVVEEKRCWGCGFCERHCPKTPSAIVVASRNALRSCVPDFEARARAAGYELQVTALPGSEAAFRQGQADSASAGQSLGRTYGHEAGHNTGHGTGYDAPPPGFLEDSAPPPGFPGDSGPPPGFLEPASPPPGFLP